ncbi:MULTISPECIES: flavin reductase family protein [unclassified Clostridioides]|uniref:flavin reductase family protein n=1 Tax=unclassified Clostridioides TaxID=2635829 RepID=UPI0006BBBB2C|nr:flavin reductase [Clostridioides difficile]MCC0690613.1 flavin reductase [Clostridioides sp. ZZV14-6387]KPI51109.1 flavin reductase [Clostridioides difficile]MCI9974528.1 flavin reductase [Clostridioides difficile]MDB3083620.1 flavin reductase [Clostridioides difficile]
MSEFKEIVAEDIKNNPFGLIGKDWTLITAEKEGKVNTMTASWGGLGVMWGKDVAFVVIRPQRYTKEFIDNTDKFSLTFFDEDFRKELSYCGKVSGREEDKISQIGFNIEHLNETPYFKEAKMAIICKKMYSQKIEPQCFIAEGIDGRWYPQKDYHTLYIAEITNVLVKED